MIVKKEYITDDTLCPKCNEELDDCDGSFFFDDFSGTNNCLYCGVSISYIKQLKEDIGNPYCKYIWDKTYLSREYDNETN